MAIVRTKRTSNFSVIDNRIFEDGNLSYQAIGLLCKLLSKPDGWNVRVDYLVSATNGTAKKTGREVVYNILKELETKGYIQRKKRATGEMDYLVFDTPNQEKPNQEKPNQEKPNQEKPNQEKPNQDFQDVLINTERQQELNNSKDGEEEICENQKSDVADASNCAADAPLVAADATTIPRSSESLQTKTKRNSKADKVPCNELLEAYNEILGGVLPKAQLLTKTRKQRFVSRWLEIVGTVAPNGKVRYTGCDDGISWWRSLFAKVKLNPFWLGENDSGWCADLDWILKPSNFVKILEWKPAKR